MALSQNEPPDAEFDFLQVTEQASTQLTSKATPYCIASANLVLVEHTASMYGPAAWST